MGCSQRASQSSESRAQHKAKVRVARLGNWWGSARMQKRALLASRWRRQGSCSFDQPIQASRGAPAEQGQPVAVIFSNVTEMLADQSSVLQIMMSGDQLVPARALLLGDGANY